MVSKKIPENSDADARTSLAQIKRNSGRKKATSAPTTDGSMVIILNYIQLNWKGHNYQHN